LRERNIDLRQRDASQAAARGIHPMYFARERRADRLTRFPAGEQAAPRLNMADVEPAGMGQNVGAAASQGG
jgi:hypothetical protein